VLISSYVSDGFLYIKSQNKKPEEKKKELSELHGYSQKILQGIAAKYHGIFLKEEKDGNYTALVSLKLANV
jgi:hypothetical protein